MYFQAAIAGHVRIDNSVIPFSGLEPVMIHKTLNSLGRKVGFIGSVLTLMTLVFSGAASAGAVTVDEVRDGNDGYANTKHLQWFNDHHSICGPKTGTHPGQTTQISYQVNDLGSVNLFL